jgi:protein-S-isoprenylcysteine O-methyltransferase Ste14
MYHQLELARSGEALFKIRGKYLSLVCLLSVIIAYWTASPGHISSDGAYQLWFLAAIVVASAGAIWRIVTSGYAALGTSGSNKIGAIAAELNTTGPYSLVRNPLYTGRILNFTGIAMLSGDWVYSLFVFLISIMVYERISVYEEEFLRKEFGDAHSRWAEHVPFLLPLMRAWKKPKYPFWVRRSIMREEKKIVWLAGTIALCNLAHHGFAPSVIAEQLLWYCLWAGVLLAYIFSRVLRRFTHTYDNIT